ncbi:MAG: DMT family transporter [Bacteroidales bacterium]|nr:DMT family transporter [Bacteroidales bacterium]
MNTSNLKAYLSVLGAVTFWGLSFVWTNKLIHLHIPIFTFIFGRLIIAGLVLLLICLCLGKIERIKKQDAKWFILMAICEPFIYFIAETFGIKSTNSPTLSALIIATIPIFTMLGDRFFYKTNISKWTVIGILLTLPGVFLMVVNGGKITSDYWWGILLLFVAVFAACGYNLCIRNLVNGYSPLTICYVQFLLGSLMFLPLMLTTRGDFEVTSLLTRDALLPILSLALLCSCLAFCLQLIAVSKIGITKASVFNATIPIVSAIASFFYGMETFTVIQVVGIMIVVFGVILAQTKPRNAI